MKHYKNTRVYKYFVSLIKKRTEKDRFIVEVPTTIKSESDKNKLMADILDILEHQIKLH